MAEICAWKGTSGSKPGSLSSIFANSMAMAVSLFRSRRFGFFPAIILKRRETKHIYDTKMTKYIALLRKKLLQSFPRLNQGSPINHSPSSVRPSNQSRCNQLRAPTHPHPPTHPPTHNRTHTHTHTHTHFILPVLRAFGSSTKKNRDRFSNFEQLYLSTLFHMMQV